MCKTRLNKTNKYSHNDQARVLKEVKAIISKYLDLKKYKLFLFGSRTGDDFRYNSDYDIGIEGKEKISFSTLSQIKMEIEELPFLIDLVDCARLDDDFKKIAKEQVVFF